MFQESPVMQRHESRMAGVLVYARKAAALLAVGFFTWLLLFSDVPLCPVRAFFGVPCPGCGMSRAAAALVRGDLHEMLHMHPLSPVILPVVGYITLRIAVRSLGFTWPERLTWNIELPSWVYSVAIVVLLGVWIARFAGYFGGPSDPVDFHHGFLGRALHAVSQ